MANAVLTRRPRSRSRAIPAFDRLLTQSRPALDAIVENVMIADRSLTLRYVNPAALHTLHLIADDIHQVFGLRIDELVGGSIHRFHHDPANVERILAEQDRFTLPHEAEFGFGRVTLRTKIVGFDDPVDGRVGYLVSWADVSDLRHAESQREQLSERLATAARAVEDLNDSIGPIARSAHETADLATGSARQTRALAEEIVRLDTQSSEIHSAIASISAVAQQTNLLALNATIEAARAGAAGKGFAVVAGEVKNLAGNTATVTADIAMNLTAITDLVAQIRVEIEDVGQRIDDIVAHQTSIAGAVEEQSAVVSDLARSIAEASNSNR
ncbi:MAG: methyl-accepting chemotaxis protein [Acidimicrobiales bacterium]